MVSGVKITETDLYQGLLIKRQKDTDRYETIWLRPVRKERYEQTVFIRTKHGSMGTKTKFLTPFEAYAEGLEVADRKFHIGTTVMVLDWSTRINDGKAWRKADHLVLQLLIDEQILYLDVFGLLSHIIQFATKSVK